LFVKDLKFTLFRLIINLFDQYIFSQDKVWVVEILAHINDRPFKAFIADRVIATQMDLLRLLNNGGANKYNGGVNMDGTTNNGGVNSLESELLGVIQSMPGLNAPALSTTINKSLRTIQRYLKKLTDEGKVEFRGAAKNGGYYMKVE
jgi:hypothetical protein